MQLPDNLMCWRAADQGIVQPLYTELVVSSFVEFVGFLWDVQHLSTHWPSCQNIVSDTRWRVMVWQQWIPCVQYVQGVQCGTMCMCQRYTLHWLLKQGTIDNAKLCTVLTHTGNSDTNQIFSLFLTSSYTKMCLTIDGNLQGESLLSTGHQKHGQVAGFVTGT